MFNIGLLGILMERENFIFVIGLMVKLLIEMENIGKRVDLGKKVFEYSL